jgi:hypothetical protein
MPPANSHAGWSASSPPRSLLISVQVMLTGDNFLPETARCHARRRLPGSRDRGRQVQHSSVTAAPVEVLAIQITRSVLAKRLGLLNDIVLKSVVREPQGSVPISGASFSS